MYEYVRACMPTHVSQTHVRRQLSELDCLSTTWVLGTELRVSGLVTSTLSWLSYLTSLTILFQSIQMTPSNSQLY